MQLHVSLLAVIMEDRIDNIKTDAKGMVQEGLEWISLARDKAASQHGKKLSVSVKGHVLHDWVSNYELFKKDSVRVTEIIKNFQFNFRGY
jgi:hypothetical protein